MVSHRVVSLQASSYWSSHNSKVIYKVPLHNYKIEVWSCGSTDGIIGLIFFEDTITSDRYVEQTFHPFFEQQQMKNTDWYAFFHQDSTPPHTLRRKGLRTVVSGQHALLISTHVNLIYRKPQSKKL
jgi:hypothetical protein